MLEDILESVDFSFKWILIAFNFLTILFLYIHQRNHKRPKQHSILFVTAHPDDQSMFFRPTLNSLTDDYHVYLLCLSGGKTQRQQSLQKACKFLKISHYKCVSDDKLVDGMKEKWCQQTIRNYVLDYIKENNIKAVFTFDQKGISDHPNHKSIYYALKDLEVEVKEVQKNKQISKLQEKSPNNQKENKQTNQSEGKNPELEEKQQTPAHIKIYYLESVMLARKYSGMWEIPLALLKSYSWITISPIHAWNAMEKHKSQFVWYRKLWVLLSRYQYINTFRRSFVKLNK